ncbi:hypothetical protein Dimus_006132, partial [Dionaea muscipula]
MGSSNRPVSLAAGPSPQPLAIVDARKVRAIGEAVHVKSRRVDDRWRGPEHL